MMKASANSSSSERTAWWPRWPLSAERRRRRRRRRYLDASCSADAPDKVTSALHDVPDDDDDSDDDAIQRNHRVVQNRRRRCTSLSLILVALLFLLLLFALCAAIYLLREQIRALTVRFEELDARVQRLEIVQQQQRQTSPLVAELFREATDASFKTIDQGRWRSRRQFERKKIRKAIRKALATPGEQYVELPQRREERRRKHARRQLAPPSEAVREDGESVWLSSYSRIPVSE